jgi:23S rRNA pseudouridine955/2504/2580 synthase
MELKTGPNDVGRRLDRVCRILLADAGLGAIYSATRKGRIRVNGQKADEAYRIQDNDVISVPGDLYGDVRPPPVRDIPARQTLSIPPVLLENDHFIVFNKPAGMLTHGTDSVKTHLDRLQAGRPRDSISFFPAPLHRLDRNTSGIVVCGNSIQGAADFSRLLREKKLQKAYLALHAGEIRGPGIWRDRIERDRREKKSNLSAMGEEAVLQYSPLLSSPAATLTLCMLVTGKTHQIRVQSGIHGHPLIGDKKYGWPDSSGRPHSSKHPDYFLHAALLLVPRGVDLPGLKEIFAPLPAYFKTEIGKRFTGEKSKRFIADPREIITKKIASISSF